MTIKIKTEIMEVPGIEQGGGPAHPFVFPFKTPEGKDCTAFNSGMSVRDVVALEVLARLASVMPDEGTCAYHAGVAFNYAEAFLAERDARDRAAAEAAPMTMAEFTAQAEKVDTLTAAVAVVRQGVDLIEGEATGAEWKRGCREFLVAASRLFSKGGA